jgi:hypothetical protein
MPTVAKIPQVLCKSLCCCVSVDQHHSLAQDPHSRPRMAIARGWALPVQRKHTLLHFKLEPQKRPLFPPWSETGEQWETNLLQMPCFIFPSGGRNLMVTSSRYLLNGSPTRCTFCNAPFRVRNGFVEFWRASNGDHFCSEFCADDAEEAHFRKRRAAAPSVAAPTTHSTRL